MHGGYSFRLRNSEGEKIFEFAVATNMMINNSLFKRKENQLITCESGGVASAIDYVLRRVNDRNTVQNIKILPGL